MKITASRTQEAKELVFSPAHFSWSLSSFLKEVMKVTYGMRTMIGNDLLSTGKWIRPMRKVLCVMFTWGNKSFPVPIFLLRPVRTEFTFSSHFPQVCHPLLPSLARREWEIHFQPPALPVLTKVYEAQVWLQCGLAQLSYVPQTCRPGVGGGQVLSPWAPEGARCESQRSRNPVMASGPLCVSSRAIFTFMD